MIGGDDHIGNAATLYLHYNILLHFMFKFNSAKPCFDYHSELFV